MKTAAAIILLSLLGVAIWAQSPAPIIEKTLNAPPTSLGIDVHEIGTGSAQNENWKSDSGSRDRDYYRTKGLLVNLRNVSRRDTGDCTATIIWFGKKLVEGELTVAHYETQPLAVGAISNVELKFWCPIVAANETQYAALGQKYAAGSKLNGWLVIIARDGRNLAARGSSPSQEQLAREPDRLTKLIAECKSTGTATAGMPQWRKSEERKKWEGGDKYYERKRVP